MYKTPSKTKTAIKKVLMDISKKQDKLNSYRDGRYGSSHSVMNAIAQANYKIDSATDKVKKALTDDR